MTAQKRLQVGMYVLFFLSGMSGLIYQIVWTRMLVLVFGNTMLAMSTVLSAFMGGLAAGSLALGWYVDRRPRRLVGLYALLEAGIGGFALVFPFLLTAATPLYRALHLSFEQNMPLLNLVRFLVCFVLISVPTFLMGGTLPVLIKRFVSKERSIGNQTGWLYGLNTAGAVVGTIACGYFLLRLLGMQRTTWVAVAINLGVALAAWILAWGEGRPEDEEPTERKTRPESTMAAREHSRLTTTMVLVGIGISGFCALAYEVFWARMLNLFLHNNVYSFTAILATFLTGIALGSFVYSKFLANLRNQVALFVSLQLGIGVFAYATPFVFSLLLNPLFSDFSESLTLLKTAVIMIGPTILMGIAVPLAVQICERGEQREGTSVGNVYAVNTFGAILGAFTAGFILLPLAGLHDGIVIVAVLNIVAGILALMSVVPPHRRVVWLGVFVVIVALLVVGTPDHLFRGFFERSKPTAEILHYKEGRVANVLVYDFVRSGYKDLHLNAVEEASSRLWHVQAFKMLGLLPVLVHEDPDDALMIAFGAGMSAGACANYVSSLDCVDLNPDIEGVAHAFTRENLDVINNPKLNRIVNDGRNALSLSPRRYSLIISDATNPKMFDSWTLYSQEFYKIVKNRLKPNGVFCQWFLIPLPGDSIPVILNTFRSVFPHMSLWCIYGSSQCLMLGTPERLEIDFLDLQERLEPIFWPSGLAAFGIDSTTKFLSFFLMGEDHLGEMLEDSDKISTDDLPHAQFHIEQDDAGIEAALDLIRHQESIAPYLINLGEDKESTERELSVFEEISRRLNLGFLLGDLTARSRQASLVATKGGVAGDANVESMLGFGPERERYFSVRIETHPDDANAFNTLGFIHWKRGALPLSVDMLKRAIELAPDFANAYGTLAGVLIDAGDYQAAEETLLALRSLNPTQRVLLFVENQLRILHQLRKLRFDPDSPDLHVQLGRLYFENGQILESIEALLAAAKEAPGDPSIEFNLAQLYEGLEFEDEATASYGRVVTIDPDNAKARTKLRELSEIQRNPERRREWLDERLRVARIGTSTGHQPTCREASRIWNEHEFEGKLFTDSLRMAVALFEESIANQPDDLHAYQDAATLHELLGNYRRAETLWHSLARQFPENRFAQIEASRLDLLARLDEGLVDKSELASTQGEIGRLYLAGGDLERASESVVHAVESAPGDTENWLLLAEIYERAGKYAEAANAAQRALELAPELTSAQEILLRSPLRSVRDKV